VTSLCTSASHAVFHGIAVRNVPVPIAVMTWAADRLLRADIAVRIASSAVPKAVVNSEFVGRSSTLVWLDRESRIKSNRPPFAQSVCNSFVSAKIAAKFAASVVVHVVLTKLHVCA